MIHENDKASVKEVADTFADMISAKPSMREKVSVLIELVYAKGRLRGHQDHLGTAPTERPSLLASADQPNKEGK